MVERGSRYVITTKDSLFVTPSVKVDKDSGKVLVAQFVGDNYSVIGLDVNEVISIAKEDYTKIDVTEELIPLEENLVLSL